MAKPITHNKRDNEKKKQEKRIEKQKRKEKRKLSGTDSFDDMIAYVDQNGMISSTPPEYNKTENSNARDTVSEKKRQSPEEYNSTVGIKGRVEYINAEKGYGFIKEIIRTDKYFFHVSGLLDSVQVGDIVLFDLERGKKGFNAVRIKKEI
ncbi:MAG: cold shock domain-containing protein [Paludibacter sp.]|nr:cold shock domain-containing protein [Paludibacter sp.]